MATEGARARRAKVTRQLGPDGLMELDEVAGLLRMTRRQVRARIRERMLPRPCLEVGKKAYYRREWVQERVDTGRWPADVTWGDEG